MQGDEVNTGAGAAPAPETPGSDSPTAQETAAAGSTDASAGAAEGATSTAEAGPSAPATTTPATPEAKTEGTAAAAPAAEAPAEAEEEKPAYAHTGTTVSVEIVPENGHGFEHAFVTGDEPLLSVLDRAMKAKENVDLKLLAQTGKVQVAVNGEFVDHSKSSVELAIAPGSKIDILTEG